jgi:hypothetical protein
VAVCDECCATSSSCQEGPQHNPQAVMDSRKRCSETCVVHNSGVVRSKRPYSQRRQWATGSGGGLQRQMTGAESVCRVRDRCGAGVGCLGAVAASVNGLGSGQLHLPSVAAADPAPAIRPCIRYFGHEESSASSHPESPDGDRGVPEAETSRFSISSRKARGCAEAGTSCDARRAVTAKPWRSRSDQRGYFPYSAQATPPPDDEIAKMCRFRTGTSEGTGVDSL